MSISIQNALDYLVGINGLIAAAVVDAHTGTIFDIKKSPGHEDFDILFSAHAESKSLNEKLKSMEELGLTNTLESVQLTLIDQYHLVYPMPSINSIYLYCILERSKADINQVRGLMSTVVQRINVQSISI